MGIVGPRVGAEPVFRRPVTTFTRDRFADFERGASESGRHIMQRRVAGGAAVVGSGLLDLQGVGDLFGARGGESGERALGMGIAQRPDEKLVLIMAAPAVAAGTRAGSSTQVFGSCVENRFRALQMMVWRVKEEDRRDDGNRNDLVTEGFTTHGEFVIEASP